MFDNEMKLVDISKVFQRAQEIEIKAPPDCSPYVNFKVSDEVRET